MSLKIKIGSRKKKNAFVRLLSPMNFFVAFEFCINMELNKLLKDACFKYQRALLHTFFCLLLKSSKAFSVSYSALFDHILIRNRKASNFL